jgi:hypothetical protein
MLFLVCMKINTPQSCDSITISFLHDLLILLRSFSTDHRWQSHPSNVTLKLRPAWQHTDHGIFISSFLGLLQFVIWYMRLNEV